MRACIVEVGVTCWRWLDQIAAVLPILSSYFRRKVLAGVYGLGIFLCSGCVVYSLVCMSVAFID